MSFNIEEFIVNPLKTELDSLLKGQLRQIVQQLEIPVEMKRR